MASTIGFRDGDRLAAVARPPRLGERADGLAAAVAAIASAKGDVSVSPGVRR